MSKNSMKFEKYRILGSFSANGYVDEDDLIGSFYGQLEGVLPEKLNLNKLYKSGKIGRIEFYIDNFEGRSTGVFKIPTSLEKEEVAFVGAALETIEQLGHTKGIIKILDICNICEDKQKDVKNRAEELIKQIENNEKVLVSPKKINVLVKENKEKNNKRIYKYLNSKCYGTAKIREKRFIILVEGKADVSKLVSLGYQGIISCNGSDVPREIVGLLKGKKVVAFLDDDKGGHQLQKQLEDMKIISEFEFAPNKKEVEELSPQEVNSVLDKYFNKNNNNNKIENSGFFEKKEFEEIYNLIERIENSGKFIILNSKLEEIDNGEMYNINLKDNKSQKYLIIDGLYEKSLDNKIKELEHNFEIIICRRNSSIFNNKNNLFTFNRIKSMIE